MIYPEIPPRGRTEGEMGMQTDAGTLPRMGRPRCIGKGVCLDLYRHRHVHVYNKHNNNKTCTCVHIV